MTFSYSSSIPNPPNDPADDVFTMQSNAASISGILAVDHVGFNLAGGGQHAQVTFNANNVPTPPTSPPILFTDSPANHGAAGGNTIPELFFYSGNATQSSNQYVLSDNGSVLLMGGIILKWGTVPAVSNGGTVGFVNAFPNNCFNVQVTLNIASTLVVIGINGFNQSEFVFRSVKLDGSPSAGVPITYFAIGN